MSKKTDLSAKDLAFVIEEAIRRLPNGDLRLAVTESPLNTILDGFYAPDFSERISSDYGMPSGNEALIKDFYEEIKTIEAVMEEASVRTRMPSWVARSSVANAEATKRLFEGLNRRGYAIQVWDWYAIPWRLHDNTISIIYSPHDVMGTPIIRSYPAEKFLLSMAEKIFKQRNESEGVCKQLSRWRGFGIVVGIIICIILWNIINRWMS